MDVSVVGVLHPGEMGSAVGAVLRSRGLEVLWASAGRSDATAERAERAGLRDAGTVRELADASDVLLSICPPHAARDVADAVGAFDGLYVDANAVSPETSRSVGARFARFVDGGIVGPPPDRAPTRLYLSGGEAAEVAALFAGTVVDTHVVSGRPGDASAVKMTYAAWTKGTAALLLAVRDAARAYGVEDVLRREWAASQPDVAARLDSAERSAERKGWRWVGEMEQIAETFAAAGLPDGFHRAAAEIYRRRA